MNKSDRRVDKGDVTVGGYDEGREVVRYWGMGWGGVDRVDGGHN
jgi:hypothetical protein